MKQICIIGGGAAGLAAAISAARSNTSARVLVIEKKEKPGKKILATGNGRCNLSNRDMTTDFYRSDHKELMGPVLDAFGYEECTAFFEDLGLILKNRDQYVYPRNDQAASVLDHLLQECTRLGVRFLKEETVQSVTKGSRQFQIQTDKQKLFADQVILAAGGKASSKLGSDGSGYKIAKSFGHTIVPVVPALVQLKVKENPLAPASGVRTQAQVSAYVNGSYAASDLGELQITANGISGIPVFQISRFISKGLYRKEQCSVILDVLPEYRQKNCKKLLKKLIGTKERLTVEDLLSGLFPLKLIPVILKQANINGKIYTSKLREEDFDRLIHAFKHMELAITDTMGFESAQVCAGGVALSEIEIPSMMSKKCPGLYLTGELLDVDGICGGYNLQWAWATGYLAGIHTARL